MKANSLGTTGLSLTQAQSVSNLCFQRASDINVLLNGINNAVKIVTIEKIQYPDTVANPVPSNIVALLTEKSKLHACQAFLMDNIKAKDDMLKELRNSSYEADFDTAPRQGELKKHVNIPNVAEDWGWGKLTASEYNKYLEAEAYASHIGQFIHKGGQLDWLRLDLPKIKTLEFMEIEAGKKTPVKVVKHHTQDQLLAVHNELASIHRKHEQEVNYYKAKVKNLVTEENARIARENGDSVAEVSNYNQGVIADYNLLRTKWDNDRLIDSKKFEEDRQNSIKKTAAFRIVVDERFKEVIDTFLEMLK
jgi:hypothetical protein